jgi:hypothetical protein
MISNAQARAEFSQQWATIAFMKSHNRSRIIGGGGLDNETAPDEFYNLPLVLAYCTLDNVLGRMNVERRFICKKKNGNCFQLSDKLKSAKNNIPWLDYEKIIEGKKARDDLAHKSTLHSKYKCISMINAVEDELKAWGIIS